MTLGEYVDHVASCAHDMPLVARRVDIFPENARTATYDEVAARGGVVNSKVCPQCVPIA